MKHVLIALLILLCFLASCSKEEDNPYEPIYSPVGNTYENQGLSLYFESEDSVCFQCLFPGDEDIKGKASYWFNGGIVFINNPYGYGGRPDPEKVSQPYFYDFSGIIKADRLTYVSFFFIGPNERLQYQGRSADFWLIKDKQKE